MTERLYYADPVTREFEAVVTAVDRTAEGQLRVRLDRTFFYPTSGGQPFDTGSLAGSRVVDVTDDEDGGIAHLVEPSPDRGAPPPAVGDRVRGVIDWPRRFDHMQQHTGQHVLSAAFDRLFGVRTVSFHLGADASTIDLARETSSRELAAAEDEANAIVWEDRPVTVRFVTADEASRLPLRKDTAREGTLRLVEVEGFDLSACGGTHVTRSGAIGMIAISSWERFKGGQRVEFVCGGRALKKFHTLRDTTAEQVRLLSVAPSELPASIARLQAELKEQRKVLADQQEELSHHRAGELADSAETAGGVRILCRALDLDANGLKATASAIASRPGFVVVLSSVSTPALVVAARSKDVDLRSNEIVSGLIQVFGGRGGGRPELAQAGGLTAPVEQVLEEARRLIASGKTAPA